jgi:hypothetical protein
MLDKSFLDAVKKLNSQFDRQSLWYGHYLLNTHLSIRLYDINYIGTERINERANKKFVKNIP